MAGRASNNIPPSLRKIWQDQEQQLGTISHDTTTTTTTMAPSATKAIVCHDTHQNGGWKMEEVNLKAPGEGELLVEMIATGICHTDALIGDIPDGAAPIAFYPRILGHEGRYIGIEEDNNSTLEE